MILAVESLVVHAALALVLQIIMRRLTGSWWAGVAVVAAWFLSREVAQAEYRWIEHLGASRRANLPWWGVIDPRAWSLDAVLDFAVPSAVACVVAAVAGRRGRARMR